MRRLLIVVVVLLAVPVPASAGGGGNMSVCSGFAAGSMVSMLDSCFEGTAHFAPAGETITVVNDGMLPHTFTAVDGSFDTGQLPPGESYEFTVEDAGIIEVFCSLHGTADGGGMAGVLVVGEAEPLPMSAPANLGVIKEAVAEESQPLANAISDHGELIAALTRAQSTGEEASWLPAVSGAAGGIALSALAIIVAGRRRPEREELPDRLRAPLEA